MNRIIEFCVDLVWACPSGPTSSVSEEPAWPQDTALKVEAVAAAFERLKDEHAAESDRIKTVETKLLSVAGLAPVAMAVVVAGFNTLTNGSLRSFTRPSVFLVGLLAGYISLQLLRAVMAAITGLRRRSFQAVSLGDLYPLPDETRQSYLIRNCKDLADVVRGNRTEINSKVTWMAVAHTAIRNAVFGLLFLLVTVIGLAIFQASP